MALQRTIKWLVLGIVSSALCGCLGGTIAQQVVRSILMKGADTVTAQQMPLKDTVPDKYQIAFVNSSFEKVSVQIEPLPEISLDDEKPLQMMQETKLVQVEVWSFLVGDEKQNILEQARIQGSTSIPPKAEWQQWQIAVGAADNKTSNKNTNAQQAITFLIPPEMGKIHSGTKALVELSSVGVLSVARYALN
jgi:hypothetical protein